MRKVTHIFEVHSNESACRKSGRLGLEQFKREWGVADRAQVYQQIKYPRPIGTLPSNASSDQWPYIGANAAQTLGWH